jgi:hypothetical protein
MGVPVISQSLWAVKSRKSVAPELFSMGRRGRGVFVVYWYQDVVLDLANAHVAQLVERVLGKDEVISSILIMGSKMRKIVTDSTELSLRM